LNAAKKIHCFTKYASGEVMWIGPVENNGTDIIVTDAFLVKQYATEAHVRLDKEAFNDFFYDLLENGGGNSQFALRFQGHSHAHMPAYFSPEDREDIEKCNGDFRVNLVINKQGDYQCRLDRFEPRRSYKHIPVIVLVPNIPGIKIESELTGGCKREIAQNVRTRLKDIPELALSFPATMITDRFCLLRAPQKQKRKTIIFHDSEWSVIPYEYLALGEEEDA
jgi:hypothetical protein